jgi:hypothetical protein
MAPIGYSVYVRIPECFFSCRAGLADSYPGVFFKITGSKTATCLSFLNLQYRNKTVTSMLLQNR